MLGNASAALAGILGQSFKPIVDVVATKAAVQECKNARQKFEDWQPCHPVVTSHLPAPVPFTWRAQESMQCASQQHFDVRVSRDSITGLGVLLPLLPSLHPWELRMSKAEKLWHAKKDVYCNRSRTLRSRILDFYSDVVSCLLWGADTWFWSTELATLVERYERQKWRCMLHLAPDGQETGVMYMHRCHDIFR